MSNDHILISDKENIKSPLDIGGLSLKKEESADSETILYVETRDQVKQSIQFSSEHCDQLEEEDHFYTSVNHDDQ